ncbi:diaminopimelate epimerase [Amantichitinum ursilacus]|uniref:Diaminopimelate epimerase n=1 Tax=Amantichitinum ursilacus TaxID=857265 RepID=A0A0N0GPP9_9NEIS|nr:diaminopimelate epimerase [Amantichitinum ursilacus]KPC53701.1 Diaminopimelate epimerase [Amantichitinum ursilacus]
MTLSFTKMQGLGNDFIVLDGINQPFTLTPEQIRQLGDRHFGIGFDQLLLVEKPTDPAHDFRYRIFNNDGGEVEQCGNGARCFVRYVTERGLTDKTEISVEVATGIIKPRLEANGLVTVDMGEPRFAPRQIPFVADEDQIEHSLQVGDETVSVSVVSMGNPHAVQVLADIDDGVVERQGPLIEYHPRFPARVNAGFMQVLSRNAVRLRVFERGVGETIACGTGACAAVVSGIRRGLLDETVTVTTRGGNVDITWRGPGQPVLMTGSAVTVFQGTVEI